MIISLLLLFVISFPSEITRVLGYDITIFNNVDADSNIDGEANIGDDGTTSYVDAQTLDGTDQTIAEGSGGGSRRKIAGGSSLNSYQELFYKRGATYRHFYNSSSGIYTYRSSYAVRKANVVPNTEWVLKKEYPIRFIVRLKNSSMYFLNEGELSLFFNQIDNSSLWGMGIEGFKGVMAFYLNFEGANGFGQYLYYPRFLNGSLPAYNYPLCQIFPHLYVNLTGTIYDNIFVPPSNVRNRIEIENSSDVLELSYTFQAIYLSRTFQFRRGFKYNLTEGRFHYVNEFKCTDESFDDVGFAYEIDRSEMVQGTNYRPYYFIIRNETHSKVLDITEAVEAGDYISNFINEIEIQALNREWIFSLNFEDMKTAGFNTAYLSIHNQLMPDDSTRLVLRVGMFDYGSYIADTTITIDPTFSEKQTTDEQDFYVLSTYEVETTYSYIRAGMTTVPFTWYWNSSIVWDTGITDTIASTSNAEISFDVQYEGVEGSEYVGLGLYFNSTLIGGFWNETYADNGNDRAAMKQICYYTEDSWHAFNGEDEQNVTIGDSVMGVFIDEWETHHDSDPSNRQYINFKMWPGTGMDLSTNEYVDLSESSYSDNSLRPTLTFDYTLTTANYMLQWEHQVNSPEVDIYKDTYQVCIYGFSSGGGNENFTISMWNPSTTEWDAPLSVEIGTTEQWYNQTFDKSYVDTTNKRVTYIFNGTIESSDSTQDTLNIDWSGITAWNVSAYDLDTPHGLSAYDPGSGYAAINISPLSVIVECGTTYDLKIKGTDVSFTPVADGHIYFNSIDNPATSTVLTTSLQTIYASQSAGNNTHYIYLWYKIDWTPNGGVTQNLEEYTLNVTVIEV